MTCSKCGEQPKVMFDGVCFTCWQKHHDAGLKAELAEVKAFAAKLSEELDRANARIKELEAKEECRWPGRVSPLSADGVYEQWRRTKESR